MFHFLRELPIVTLRAISDGIEWLLVAIWKPFQRESDEDVRPWYKTAILLPLLIPYLLFRLALGVLAFPFRSFFLPPERRRHYLRGIPAMLVVTGGVIGLVGYLFVHDRIISRYINRARGELVRNDVEKSIEYGRRLVTERSSLNTEGKFLYAVSLAQQGTVEGSLAVLEEIAPDNSTGFMPAHQMRAMEFGRLLSAGEGPREELLPKMLWHLEQSGEARDERMHGLWATYYELMGEKSKAISRLEKAGKTNPAFFVKLSEIYRDDGNESMEQRSLSEAAQGYSDRLRENPLSKNMRIQLALTLARQKKWADAEGVLLNGVQLHRDKETLETLADFYLMRLKEETDSDAIGAEQLDLLLRALRVDVNHFRTYAFLSKLFDDSRSDEELRDLRELLEERLVDGGNAALAHFGLGCWFLMQRSNDQGQWHLKQAMALDPIFVVACNNLAFAYILSEPKRLDESFSLVSTALEFAPESTGTREMLGTVQLERGELDGALETLLRVVSENAGSKGTHAKLARVYRERGEIEDAEKHEALSK
ncbi:MAG: hypothetical protein FJ308_08180 [Planctomycetes bacterium]|nr:hypothetical protein [Planctomycetota bacterium]